MFRMTKKLEKELEVARICANCEYSVSLADSNSLLCRKKGIVEETGGCRKFRYDLLKRKPPKPVSLPKEPLPSLEFPEEPEKQEEAMEAAADPSGEETEAAGEPAAKETEQTAPAED